MKLTFSKCVTYNLTKVQSAAVLPMGDHNHFQSMKKLELFLHPLEGKIITANVDNPRYPPRYVVRTPNNS